MDTKISLIGLAIIIMLAIGITSGDLADYDNCKISAITTNPSESTAPNDIAYAIESNQLPPYTTFYIFFDGSQNANYLQEEANLLRDAYFSGQSVTIGVGDRNEILKVICPSGLISATESRIMAAGTANYTTNLPANELRQTVAKGESTSIINNPGIAKLLNNTKSIGVTKFLNPQPLPPGISRGGSSAS